MAQTLQRYIFQKSWKEYVLTDIFIEIVRFRLHFLLNLIEFSSFFDFCTISELADMNRELDVEHSIQDAKAAAVLFQNNQKN